MDQSNVDIVIQESFDSTLKDTDLQNLVINISDLGIDLILKDPSIQNLPIVGTLVGITKFGINIHDKLFLKKILSFINELKNISAQERKETIDLIDKSKKYRVKVGEKLLYIIDSCNDFENSELVARLFKAFIEKKISYDDFLGTSNIIQKITSRDLRWFFKEAKDYMNTEDINGLISSGLFDLKYEQVNVRVLEEDDRKTLMEGGDKYKTDIDGGNVTLVISRMGDIIMDLLSDKKRNNLF